MTAWMDNPLSQRLLGSSPMQNIESGTQLITDASQRVGGQSTLEKLFQEQVDLSQYGTVPRYQGQGLYDASSVGVGGKGSVLSELLKLNRTY